MHFKKERREAGGFRWVSLILIYEHEARMNWAKNLDNEISTGECECNGEMKGLLSSIVKSAYVS